MMTFDNALVYDIEIVNAIPTRREPIIEGIKYCAGWDDHANMGISVIGAYDFQTGRSHVYLKDNFDAFEKLCRERWPLVSFNGLRFDNPVIRACGLEIDDAKCYDLLAEITALTGTFAGYSLDACCKATLGPKAAKTGNGAMAPVLWQRGQFGEVITYCLNDVAITADLFRHLVEYRCIDDPVKGGELMLALPKAVTVG